MPSVPATVVAGRAVHGWNPEALAELLGVAHKEAALLPPSELAEKLDAVLTAAQNFIAGVSGQALETKSPGRGRTLRTLCFHVFRIGGAFVDTLEQGFHREEWLNEPLPEKIHTGAHLSAYGGEVRNRLAAWFAAADPAIFPSSVDTYYGPQTVHQLLGRTVWHAAHHLRQAHDLAAKGGSPAESLDGSLFDGLPMPGQLW